MEAYAATKKEKKKTFGQTNKKSDIFSAITEENELFSERADRIQNKFLIHNHKHVSWLWLGLFARATRRQIFIWQNSKAWLFFSWAFSIAAVLEQQTMKDSIYCKGSL